MKLLMYQFQVFLLAYSVNFHCPLHNFHRDLGLTCGRLSKFNPKYVGSGRSPKFYCR